MTAGTDTGGEEQASGGTLLTVGCTAGAKRSEGVGATGARGIAPSPVRKTSIHNPGTAGSNAGVTLTGVAAAAARAGELSLLTTEATANPPTGERTGARIDKLSTLGS